MESKKYHTPVLLHTSVDAILDVPHKQRIFVDATFGGGGHSRLILSKMQADDHLFAFDKDEDAQANILENENFHFIAADFKDIKKYLLVEGVHEIDGILADIGVSSHQFDTADRGFSFRFDAALDMRMDQTQSLSAFSIVNEYSEDELKNLLQEYAEITNAYQVANTICKARSKSKIETTGDLIMLLRQHQYGKEEKFLACVFQALRIEVNGELNALKKLLIDGSKILKKGGKMVVISYHSLEDRLVKNFFKNGDFVSEVEKDLFGKKMTDPVLKPIGNKAITPTKEEEKNNPRSRSAKMRIAVKL